MNGTVNAAVIAAIPGGLEGVDYALEVWQGNTKKGTLRAVDVRRNAGRLDASQLSATVFGFDGLLPDEVMVGDDRLYGDDLYGTGRFGDRVRTYLKGLVQVGYTEVRASWTATVAGVDYTAQMGRFFLAEDSFAVAEDDETLTLVAYDVRHRVSKAGYRRPRKVATGTTVTAALDDVVGVTAPAWVTTSWPSALALETVTRVWLGLDGNSDPWQDIVDFTSAEGFEATVTASGVVTAYETPNLAAPQSPVWVLRDGDGGTIMSAVRAHNDEDLVNTVVVRSQNSEAGRSIYGIAEDTLPDSQTSIAKVGRRTLVLNKDKVKSSAKATTMATNVLRRRGGLVEAVDLVLSGPVPHLEPGDVVTVQVTALELDDDFVIDRVSFGFGPDADTTVSVSRRIV